MISSNSRVGTVTNLPTGGTYDLLVVKIEGEYPEGKVSFGLYDVPMKITGLQKVAQQFLRVLLTTKGSDPFYPNKGTFMTELMVGSNIVSNDNSILSDITSAVADASNQVRSMLNVNTSDLDSTLDVVEVIGIDRVEEGWFIALSLSTLSGQTAAVSLPFPEFGLS